METLVFSTYGLWFWLTRKYRTARYSEAAAMLNSARHYLLTDYAGRASGRDRGYLLHDQVEALAILQRHGALASQTAQRFTSLSACCKFVTQELTQPQLEIPELPQARVPTVLFITPVTNTAPTSVATPVESTQLLAS